MRRAALWGFFWKWCWFFVPRLSFVYVDGFLGLGPAESINGAFPASPLGDGGFTWALFRRTCIEPVDFFAVFFWYSLGSELGVDRTAGFFDYIGQQPELFSLFCSSIEICFMVGDSSIANPVIVFPEPFGLMDCFCKFFSR